MYMYTLKRLSRTFLQYISFSITVVFMPLFEKGGHIALHLSVGMSVGMSVCRSVGMSVALNLVQLITQECFAPEASNLVGG